MLYLQKNPQLSHEEILAHFDTRQNIYRGNEKLET